jgi:hypothetical protein
MVFSFSDLGESPIKSPVGASDLSDRWPQGTVISASTADWRHAHRDEIRLFGNLCQPVLADLVRRRPLARRCAWTRQTAYEVAAHHGGKRTSTLPLGCQTPTLMEPLSCVLPAEYEANYRHEQNARTVLQT